MRGRIVTSFLLLSGFLSTAAAQTIIKQQAQLTVAGDATAGCRGAAALPGVANTAVIAGSSDSGGAGAVGVFSRQNGIRSQGTKLAPYGANPACPLGFGVARTGGTWNTGTKFTVSAGILSADVTKQAQPVVSTVNDLQGQIVANCAIVPTGAPSGGIIVYGSDLTISVIGIKGYFGQ